MALLYIALFVITNTFLQICIYSIKRFISETHQRETLKGNVTNPLYLDWPVDLSKSKKKKLKDLVSPLI